VDSWYRVVMHRKEAQEGRRFSPDSFAIALEHVVAGMVGVEMTSLDNFAWNTRFWEGGP